MRTAVEQMQERYQAMAAVAANNDLNSNYKEITTGAATTAAVRASPPVRWKSSDDVLDHQDQEAMARSLMVGRRASEDALRQSSTGGDLYASDSEVATAASATDRANSRQQATNGGVSAWFGNRSRKNQPWVQYVLLQSIQFARDS